MRLRLAAAPHRRRGARQFTGTHKTGLCFRRALISAALGKMRTKKYGLVISDWNMEPMTGYDLLREVRASAELSHTPFIMITAESKTENIIAARKAGVSNYIVKPFNAATLKTKIEAVFPEAAK